MLLLFNGQSPTLNDWQFMYGVGGVVLNGEGAPPFTDITSINGLDTPDIKVVNSDKDGGDGGYSYAKFYDKRVVEINMDIYGDGEAYLDRLKRNFAPHDAGDWLFWKPPFEDVRLLFCKPTTFKYTIARDRVTSQRVQAQLIFQAEDPHFYSGTQYHIVQFPGLSTTGRKYPKIYPYVYGTYHLGGELAVTNNGSADSGYVMTFSGILSHPLVQNLRTGEQMYLDVSLGAGDVLRVDTINQLITLNGKDFLKALRTGSSWLTSVRGNNQLNFSSSAAGVGAQVTVATRDAWV